MRGEITKRQKEFLKIIYSSLKNEGYPPSFEDFKNELGIKSNQAIIDHLKSLEKKNLIKREEGSARGIAIKPLGYKAISKSPLVRFAGVSAAGPTIEAIDQQEWVKMPSGYQKYENVFIVKVSGNSMIEAGIYDGDSVLIKEEKQYKSGDIVLARIGDEVTIKRFVFDSGRTYLKSENPVCRDIAITHDTYFLGKMISTLEKGE